MTLLAMVRRAVQLAGKVDTIAIGPNVVVVDDGTMSVTIVAEGSDSELALECLMFPVAGLKVLLKGLSKCDAMELSDRCLRVGGRVLGALPHIAVVPDDAPVMASHPAAQAWRHLAHAASPDVQDRAGLACLRFGTSYVEAFDESRLARYFSNGAGSGQLVPSKIFSKWPRGAKEVLYHMGPENFWISVANEHRRVRLVKAPWPGTDPFVSALEFGSYISVSAKELFVAAKHAAACGKFVTVMLDPDAAKLVLSSVPDPESSVVAYREECAAGFVWLGSSRQALRTLNAQYVLDAAKALVDLEAQAITVRWVQPALSPVQFGCDISKGHHARYGEYIWPMVANTIGEVEN